MAGARFDQSAKSMRDQPLCFDALSAPILTPTRSQNDPRRGP